MAHTSGLAFAVRGPVVRRYLGELCIGLAVLPAVPCIWAMATGAWAAAMAAGATTVAFVAGGVWAARVSATPHIQRNEGLVVTTAAFALGALALVPIFVVEGTPLLDGVFEAVSAVTTTGLTALETVEDRSSVFLLTRAWGQWFGGLAIIVLALALIVEPGGAARRLAGGQDWHEDLVGGTRAHARRALVAYAGLTVVAGLVLWLLVGDGLAALLHALAAVSTGGFSSFDASVATFGGWGTQVVTVAFGLAGAVSFSLYLRAWRGDWSLVWTDDTVRVFAVSVGCFVALLALTMVWNGDGEWGDALRRASVLGVSAHSTTGFANTAVSDLESSSKLVLIVSMAIGGDVGSTAGGIKILRAVVVFRFLWLAVTRAALPPHAVAELRAAGRRVPDEELHADLGLVALFGAVMLLSWFPFLVGNHDPIDSLFEVASALGTVGLSTGITAPELSAGLKLVLCADMLLGRLEILAVLVFIDPRTWIGRRAGAV